MYNIIIISSSSSSRSIQSRLSELLVYFEISGLLYLLQVPSAATMKITFSVPNNPSHNT